MKKLFWQTIGHGKQNVVLIHGFGMNSEIWKNVVQKDENFQFHMIDLPGHGHNHDVSIRSIERIVQNIWNGAPENSIWLGWSLGGLIAAKIALQYFDKVSALITVASSLYFIREEKNLFVWPGLTKKSLNNFMYQLNHDFESAIERFLIVQNLRSTNAKKNTEKLKSSILRHPKPTLRSLSFWMKILKDTDLRSSISGLKKPFLRIYGGCDQIVPKSVIPSIDKLVPRSQHVIIKDASHAPFLSHSKIFNDIIFHFYQKNFLKKS
ncbi:pimeloyl-ACP methyl ester esterase BioH [Candidatus Riesia pediculischaeffi]|uniref:Pimeloyl-[acyl-carrier protein] methyl ester esterase n=2 Tax=Candidatus Riesia pediculischaeffi TaxID=428411 RepID=A0A1V0HKX7_9ENTR|nr:pimeloyl-ACP methyl ester esterase BioH [Candidatus Riesia pediculischaeffi]ARC53488.1 hypothetical protein AOQ87_02475 [Candidatus Riesia pediculischaeffi]KIE64287.1 Biotin synthesis protein bioH [Candidatus Riesia pediculischaeffi PTSU]